jgi:hypothetical protein
MGCFAVPMTSRASSADLRTILRLHPRIALMGSEHDGMEYALPYEGKQISRCLEQARARVASRGDLSAWNRTEP